MGRRVFTAALAALVATFSLAALAFGWGGPGMPRAGGGEGTLRLSSSAGGRPILSGANLVPGGAVAGAVTIRNRGKGPGTLTLTRRALAERAGLGGGLLSGSLALTVRDVTSRSDGVVYSGPLGTMPKLRVAYLEPGERRQYSFAAELPDSLGASTLEAAQTSFDYRWQLAGSEPKKCALKFRGDEGPNRIVGSAGGDKILGGAGKDKLFGGDGDDCVVAGTGKDLVDCGPGEDTAKVGSGDVARGCERLVKRG